MEVVPLTSSEAAEKKLRRKVVVKLLPATRPKGILSATYELESQKRSISILVRSNKAKSKTNMVPSIQASLYLRIRLSFPSQFLTVLGCQMIIHIQLAIYFTTNDYRAIAAFLMLGHELKTKT